MRCRRVDVRARAEGILVGEGSVGEGIVEEFVGTNHCRFRVDVWRREREA